MSRPYPVRRLRRGALFVMLPLAAATPGTLTAQAGIAPLAERARWTVDAQYLHLGAGPIGRRAPESMAIAAGRDVGRAGDWRAELGWLRAARTATNAEGVTLGASLGLGVGAAASPRLVVRPGVALLAGWAEAQRTPWLYDWRGLHGTSSDGERGSATRQQAVRGRTTGVGASLGAELRLARGVALAGSVRGWRFAGDVMRPSRDATLGGIGLVVRPAMPWAGLGRGE